MNEFQITNARFIDSRLSDLEDIAGGNPVSSPEVKIQNAKAFQGDAGIDWSICALGYVINPDGDDPDEIKIVAGEIDRHVVAETKMVVLDGEFVYVRRTIADNTMLVTHAAAVPANDDTYFYYKLYEFNVASGVATIKKIWRPFAIEAGSAHGGLPSNANKSKWMVLTMSADNATAVDNPDLWSVDWVRAHA